MNSFKLVSIKEVKINYPFLKEYEGFDLYEDWNDDDFFVITEGNAIISGNLNIDIFEDDLKAKFLATIGFNECNELRIEGILINGDLVINGCLINAIGDYGPFLFVSGNLSCQSVLLGGAYVIIKGNLNASEVIFTNYNHGYFKSEGTVKSPVFIVYDHCTNFHKRDNSLFYYNDRENNYSYKDGNCPKQLLQWLDNPLTSSFEELIRDLENGEHVLKGQKVIRRDYQYWEEKVERNYRDLKRVPVEFKTKELCVKTLDQTFYALEFFNPDFISMELCEQLVEKDGFAIKVVPPQFITTELCWKAAKSGIVLSCIPEEFYSPELILEVFQNSKFQSDIRDVPREFISENFVTEYVKIGKGLWLDDCCKKNSLNKTKILKNVIDTGIEFLDVIFAHHCTDEAFEYAKNQYQHQEAWELYIEKYKSKLTRLNLI